MGLPGAYRTVQKMEEDNMHNFQRHHLVAWEGSEGLAHKKAPGPPKDRPGAHGKSPGA